MLTEKIGVIGAGKIGSAIARGIIRAGLVNKESVMCQRRKRRAASGHRPGSRYQGHAG